MNKKPLLFIPVALLSMMNTSCAGETKNHYSYDDYVAGTLKYKENFRILQLTDTHIANKDYQDEQLNFLKLTIDDANADFIIVTGDLFTFADKATARRFFDFLDSFNTPWTVTFGNHDEQCYFSVDWLTNELNTYGSNCIFKDLQDDDVFGNANFVINLTEDGTSNSLIKEQLFIIDSNRYNYGEYVGYDYIHYDQIDWYEMMVNGTTKYNHDHFSQSATEKVPSLAFFHIPFEEFEIAYGLAEQGDPRASFYAPEGFRGENNETTSCPQKNTGFFAKIKELGSTKGCFVGHDHKNSYAVNYDGILLCYGINSTDRIYYKDDLLGGQVVTMNIEGVEPEINIQRYFHTYSEVR